MGVGASAIAKRLLDFEPETGVSTYHHYDDLTDVTTIETTQDAEPYLEHNKAVQNVGATSMGLNEYSREGIKANWWHVASIPVGVQMEWLEQGINLANYSRCDWTKRKVNLKLNSSEYAYLRTGTGKI